MFFAIFFDFYLFLAVLLNFYIDLDDNMRRKLKELLDSQIAGLLHRIDEEMPSVNSEDSYKR